MARVLQSQLYFDIQAKNESLHEEDDTTEVENIQLQKHQLLQSLKNHGLTTLPQVLMNCHLLMKVQMTIVISSVRLAIASDDNMTEDNRAEDDEPIASDGSFDESDICSNLKLKHFLQSCVTGL